MLLTIINKYHVDQVFDKALANRHIEAIRSRSTPTILNNLLWACVAEDKDKYYVGLYSIFDSDPNLHYLNVIPKNDSIQRAFGTLPEYQTLEWFSDGYLAAFPTDSVTYLCDLRYGGMSDTIKDQRDLVFNFKAKEVDGVVTFTENREPPKGNIGDIFRKLVKRMKGY
jgi:inner membrane protein